MSTLFSGSLAFPQGVHTSAVIPVPGNIKQPGAALTIKASFVSENFAAGTTKITLFISLDGGATFLSASMTCVNPASFRGPAPHFWVMTFGLGADDIPTHAKYETDAPSAFSTPTILEAVSGGS